MVPSKPLFLFLIFTVAGLGALWADEETRQVQEELRKRHLYFRDIDGRESPEYSMALKRYQQRQGFAQTGRADDVTLYSLRIGEPPSPAEGVSELPDVPVLKSDAACHEPVTRPSAPIAVQNASDVSKAEIQTFLRRYFDACQSPNPDDELTFFADRVDYFDHGIVDRPYIKNELAVYDQRWPARKYTLGDSVKVVKTRGGTVAKVRIAFQVANAEHNRKAGGRTDNTFSVAKRNDSLEIVAIKEARVRKHWRYRKRPPPAHFPTLVGRTIHHVFRSIFR
jgi:peptidoglycan hydrolase-like protein with peptidoglycan-binding domain